MPNLTLTNEQVIDLFKQLPKDQKREVYKILILGQWGHLEPVFDEGAERARIEIATEIEAYRKEDLTEKWAKWFQEVEEIELPPSEISEEDYENLLVEKYKQQGLIL